MSDGIEKDVILTTLKIQNIGLWLFHLNYMSMLRSGFYCYSEFYLINEENKSVKMVQSQTKFLPSKPGNVEGK